MKAKDLIDRVLEFYRTPGNTPGIDDNSDCMYWISETSQCAIGCLVSDPRRLQQYTERSNRSGIAGIYKEAGESNNSDSDWVLSEIEKLFPSDIPHPILFIANLQYAHDRAARAWNRQQTPSFVETLLPALDGIKAQYDLD